MRNVHKILASMMLLLGSLSTVSAQRNSDHIQLGTSWMYERGLEATLSYEHSTQYHNAYEYFVTYHIQYDIDKTVGHYTKESFWNNYRTYHIGAAYKPCVIRRRNNHGNLRIGGSVGSNTDKFLGGIHVGYEHTFSLYKGWELYFNIKEDVIIPEVNSDLFRTGTSVGFKIPLYHQ